MDEDKEALLDMGSFSVKNDRSPEMKEGGAPEVNPGKEDMLMKKDEDIDSPDDDDKVCCGMCWGAIIGIFCLSLIFILLIVVLCT